MPGNIYNDLATANLSDGRLQLWASDPNTDVITFWKKTSDPHSGWTPVIPFQTPEAKAFTNGVLLDSLRAKGRLKGMTLQEPTHAKDQAGRNQPGDRQLWERIQHLFPDLRERRVAYFLFQCNLSPRPIFLFAPQEFSDVQEICRLRARILEQILLHSDLIC